VRSSTAAPSNLKNIAAALVLCIRRMREMHWDLQSDEWQYWIKGKGA